MPRSSVIPNCVSKEPIIISFLVPQKITKKSSQLKGEIYELIKHQYVDFDSYVGTIVSLEKQLREVVKDHRRLSNKIEQDLKGRMSRIVEERPEIESQLKETQERIHLVQNLVAVYQGIEMARKNLTPGNYVACAEHLQNASEALESIGSSGCESKVYRALKSELSDVVSELRLKLREEWAKFVSWKPKSLPDNPKLNVLSSIELRVTTLCTSGLSMNDVIKGMKLLEAIGVWTEKVKSFAQKLLEMFVRPLIANKNLSLELSKESPTKQVFRIVQSGKPPVSVAELYNNLTTIFTAIRQVVSEQYQQEWMAGIGEIVCQEMSELIIAHRLSTAIPKDSVELARYGKLSSQTKEFEGSLVNLGLASEEKCQNLSRYTDDVNSHFAAQKSQDLLAHARSILLKPIHDTVSAAQVDPLGKLADLAVSTSAQTSSTDPTYLSATSQNTQCTTSDLSDLTFSFPTCVISKSVLDYVDLLYSTLRECSATPSMALHLFTTARNMVDLFCAVLPSYHRQSISEIPRIAIVQHNNCMYLAHHLITLGHQFHSHLPPPVNSEVATFVDYVPLVRQLGEQVFLDEMRKQSATILEAIKACGGFDNVSEDHRSQCVRRGIQQALLHTVKLSQIYAEVLPDYIHCKSVGALLNVLTSEVVKNVLALEDIAMDDATELHSLLNLVLDRGPLVLSSSDEETQSTQLTMHCSSWGKLKQLSIVLDASLQKIVDSWDSGNGPLAQEFTPVEIRGLIKALFKNTERRAAALAKITL